MFKLNITPLAFVFMGIWLLSALLVPWVPLGWGVFFMMVATLGSMGMLMQFRGVER